MFGIGPMELVLIFVVALLVFGPKRLPELARTLGRGMAEFRRASNDLRQSLALDELQQDLRRNLTEEQTIHRPGDRPAQAGDVAPGTEASVPNPKDASSGAPNTEGEGEGSPSEQPKHPGELPLGNDHEHHDVDSEEETSEGNTPSTSPTTSSGLPSPADPELGNVPVSGVKPTDPRRG